MSSIDTMVNEAIRIANDNTHGYSQPRRGGNPDFDCSSLTAHCLIKGGWAVDKLSTTSTLYDQLKKLGWKTCNDSVKKGDILLTPGKHVVIAISNNQVVTASSDYDGKVGDSSGKEIRVRSYYTPSYGWKYHLRFVEDKTTGFTVGKTYTVVVDNLNIRYEASTSSGIKKKSELTDNAKKVTNSKGQLMKGCKVTCKALRNANGILWMQIPSGWIATTSTNGKAYVK